MAGLEIVCTECGADTLLRREPLYEGFRKTGENLFCAACGFSYESEKNVPYKDQRRVSVFDESDKPKIVDVFAGEERGRNCRYCRHYLVNPFTQRCGLHFKEVQATDVCDDFEIEPDCS